MGSSVKKKKEKKKDFQKPRLKVGKAKPKASNFTDTSFKAKSIVVNKQSLSVTAPAASAQFAHHVSLLKNRSDSQRAESLAFLTTAITSTPLGAPMALPGVEVLPKLLPLVLDGSSAVRGQLLKLLQVLSARSGDVQVQSETILLYVHAAMSHLSADIRGFSVEVLDWLLECAPAETVGCAGGWTKTLACFISLLGWRAQERGNVAKAKQRGWSSVQKANTPSNAQSRSVSRQLSTLAKLLHAGLDGRDEATARNQSRGEYPVRDIRQHVTPASSAAFAHLNIFGPTRDDDASMLEDYEERRQVFAKRYRDTILEGAEQFVKEGGDLGRGAATVRKAVVGAMDDLGDEDVVA